MTVLLLAMALARAPAADRLDAYDVVWDSFSIDSAGSMPIGNGEVVLNVWVEAATGDVMFYIARTDALSEISRFLKLGRVRVHMEPSPFKSSTDFKQRLHLRDGRIEITGRGATLRLFVDAGADVIQLDGKFAEPTSVRASIECWRNAPRALPKAEQQSAWSVHDAPFPLIEAADIFTRLGNGIAWYHRNESSVVPQLLENQSLVGLKGTFDPIIHRTFGGLLAGNGFVPAGERVIEQAAPSREFQISIATASAQANSITEWLSTLSVEAGHSSLGSARIRTAKWWHSYWDRSWVYVGPVSPPPARSPFAGTRHPENGEGVEEVARGYVLQRYVQACQGRGKYPIKFNGGYYTVEPTAMGRSFDADWRNWGDSQWWQNIRHIYHPMLASGDFEMMEPFFRLYEKARPLAEARSKLYHGSEGAYFPETMTVFGTYSGGDYGWDRSGHQPKDVLCPWWDDAWNQGPELVALMLDRWDYTRDETFLRKRVLPMAESVLRYFDTRFKKDADGRIVLDPTQVVETYWEGVKNDMPATAGLIAITNRLTTIPPRLLTFAQRTFFQRMRAACPKLPVEMGIGGLELAPAQAYAPKTSNVENGELYAVWPFRLVSLARPQMLAEAKRAYDHRLNRLDTGWGYDGNAAALLGMTEEAARILKAKCANSNPAYRWPATWGPNFDWLPDQNHGGNLLNTTHLMLLQCEPIEAGGDIRILPAWPKEWDVDFKLYAPGNTVVRCRAANGKIIQLEVTPEERLRDVVWPPGWAR